MSNPNVSERQLRSSEDGFTLLEMIVGMGLMTVVMAITLGGLSNATKANDSVVNLTSMNNSIRIGMDMMVRDLLQVGSGLPPSHNVQIPSGANSSQVRIPGPPGTAFTLPAGALVMDAVVPLPGVGPTVNGTATDVVVMLTADNTFVDQSMTAMTSTTVDIAAGTNIATGPDRVIAGQLMMVSKGSTTTLLEVTAVDTSARRLTFAAADSLNLNQPSAAGGTLAALNAAAPANTPSSARITRVRMISYYLDSTTDAQHPRLVRRINNGNATTFNNQLGNAVAIDVENLQFTYDLIDGVTNPSDVRMVASDLGGSGRCSPNACTGSQIRKINIALTGRSSNAANANNRIYRNTLSSEVSFRGMAFINEYQAP